MAPSVTIIMPTGGRRPESLRRALDSILDQLEDRDEVRLVRADGRFGGTARNLAMVGVKTDLMCFLDDDDVFLPDGLETIRRGALAHPRRILLFRATDNWDHVMAGRPGTCFVVPMPGPIGVWPDLPENDKVFMAETLGTRGEDVVLLEEVFCNMDTISFAPDSGRF